MLISSALAQAAAPVPSTVPGTPDLWTSPLPVIVFTLVIFYFLIMRPQARRTREHQAMIKNLRRGDTVVTAGGLIGKVDKIVDDAEVVVDLGETKVRVVRATLTDVRSKNEPAKAANDSTPKSRKDPGIKDAGTDAKSA